MNRNRIKHKVLGLLIESYNKDWDNAPHYGAEYLFRIDENLDTSTNKLLGACFALSENGDVSKSEDDEYNTMFRITDRGRYSYYEKIYLKRIWWMNRNFYIYILSLSISAGALTVSIIALVTD